MDTILDYKLLKKLDETWDSITYRCRKEGQSRTFLIQVIKTGHTSPSDIARFKQEYDLIKNAEIDGVIDFYEIINNKNELIIIFEDFDGIPLNKAYDLDKISLKTFLQIAIRLAEIIGNLHKKDIIHKNLNPDNIIINSETLEIRIIGFGFFSLLNHKIDVYNPDYISGILAYASPEQIGRINRTIDYRTDFYSLGITLYYLLTGELPFISADPMEVIHSHIAIEPSTPIDIDPDIPVVISDIIMKLLSKTVEDRYQNGFGLMLDFQECFNQYESKGRIEAFDPGKKDTPIKYIYPREIIGREKEIDILIDVFERVYSGESGVMLVSGPPGIGKTMLVNEIQKLTIEKRGYFISGKYNHMRDIPYYAIIQAFQGLVKQILAESKDTITIWKENLLNALEPNGRVISNIIPEIELIIGEQPAIPELGPEESRNRFHHIFEVFISTFAKEEHPITIFLDDLQWADRASLQLIKNMIVSPHTIFLLLTGTYRDNEVSETHPLFETLKEIEEIVKVNRLTLSPLTKNNVKDFIVDRLRCSEEKVTSLTEQVYKKTGGNPFFVNQFLHTLYNEKYFELDALKGWQWDIDKISRMQATENVIELMVDKINRLPENAQEVLKICACMGNRFDLEILSFILNKSLDKALAVLHIVIGEGYVELSGDGYVFHHDRIQEAVYSIMSYDEKTELHYKIGKTTLERTNEVDLVNNIFNIVDQLNLGSELIKERQEHEELIKLNLEAGNKAKESAAYSTAFEYLKVGIELLGKVCWDNQYDLSLAIYTDATEAAYLKGDLKQMDRLAEVVIRHARTTIDKMKVFQIKNLAYIAQGDFHRAMISSKAILKLLDFEMPDKTNKIRIFLELIKIKSRLMLKNIDYLIDTPKIINPKILAISEIITGMGSVLYIISPNLFALSAFKAVNLAIKHGYTIEHSIHVLAYGLIHITHLRDIDEGYKISNLVVNYIRRFNIIKYKSKILYLYYFMVHHWKNHLNKTIAPFLDAYQIGIETGDIEFAAYNLIGYLAHSVAIGMNLVELEQDVKKQSSSISQLNNLYISDQYAMTRQLIENLLGQSNDPTLLIGKVFDEREAIPRLFQSNVRNTIAALYCIRLLLCYLFYNYSQALENSELSRIYIDAILGSIFIRLHPFYESLTMLALYPNATRKQKRKYLRRVAKNQKMTKKWAMHAPMNNLHHFCLVEAELSRVKGKHMLAEEYYDRAIRLSKEYEYINDEALSYELAAKYYQSYGKDNLAKSYMTNAYNCYSQWGAIAKLKHLEETYPELLSSPDNSLEESSKSSEIKALTDTSKILDLSSVMKASQAISSEIVFSKLLVKMIKITMEFAGAQKAFLIFENKGNLLIEAEGTAGSDEIIVLKSIPINRHKGLSTSIINYVSRTEQTVILNNASEEKDFSDDPYIAKNKPKSIHCSPILNKGTLSGILYLENNLITNAFTPGRQEILNILSSQIAISIENAGLYTNLEDRTTELVRAYRKLKEFDVAKTNFFANVSHELRTPLTLILSIVETIRHGEYGDTLKRDNELLGSVHKNSIRLLKLINNLLDFSKIEAGRMTIKRKKSNISKLLKHYSSGFKLSAESEGLSLYFKDNTTGVIAWVDQDLTEKAVYNLLSNAIKFTPEGGVITVELDKKEDQFSISVTDTGIGIPRDKLETIFERFSQVDPSATRKYEGTGIGLSLANEIIELHKGRITVQSQPGKGSTFKITMPIHDSEYQESFFNMEHVLDENIKDAEVIEEGSLDETNPYLWDDFTGRELYPTEGEEKTGGEIEEKNRKSHTILIVEDNQDMLKFLNILFRKEYNTINASNGKEAYDKFVSLNKKPDLILADVMMPEMDGYELTSAIRSDSKYDALPIILLTAKAGASMKIKGIENGANDYIVKPFNPRELVLRVKSQLQLKSITDRLKGTNERLNQILSDSSVLVSDIGHKFYNELWPLTELKNIGARMLNMLEGRENDIDREYLEFVRRTLEKCGDSLHRIEKMKDKIKNNFGKKGDKIYNKAKYIIDEALNKYKDKFIEHNITLEKIYNFDSEKEIKINSEQIEIALENILNNSIEALNSTGNENNKKIIVSAESQGKNFIITIEDNGPGISIEVGNNIFTMFFSVDDNKSSNGLGLGLHISRWIIEDCHNGRIEMESRQGEYTRFRITLPEDADAI